MKRVLILLIFVIGLNVKSQVTYNSYARISNISGTTMTVTNLTETPNFSFAVSGNVLLMQMQDDVIGANTTNASTFGDLGTNASVGLWEQKTISSITRSGTTATIVLSSALVNSYNTGANSSLQIISFPLLNAAAFTTSANISGTAWTGSVGGIVAFEVGTTLTLNHNISANALGFKGGTVSTNYYPGGTTCDTVVNTWRQGSNIRGQKGEGIYKITNAIYEHGKAKCLNGGGGGSNINAGGGGGGNWTAGGDGGPGWPGTCPSPGAAGRGGISLSTLIPLNRIFMGGGGGGGQQNNSSSTPGGRGGGIVVVKAGTLTTSGTCANPRIISANGQSVTTGGSDGQGGAGAGGSIVLQISTFNVLSTCQLSVTANGANGGTVNTSTHAGGGAGGQGVIVYSIAQPTTNVTSQTNNGIPGCNNNSVPCNSAAGSASGTNGSGILSPVGGFLPIELISFKAQKQGNHVLLTWVTSSETNNDYFTIEKSSDAISFSNLEKVKTKAKNGNSSKAIEYSAKDFSPYTGTSYYRLKQTDLNGASKQHQIVSVDNPQLSDVKISVYPNPNYGNFTIEFSGINKESDMDIQLFDISGKQLFSQHLNAGFNTNTINVIPSERLTAGVYICNIISQGVKFPVKVVVQ
ncbi:MAG: T9SS type A sorting domain-containing protein [Sphingobacteriaceae bacterium]